MKKVHPIDVAPIGKRKAVGFRCPGGYAEWEEPVYPESPRGEALRESRVRYGVGLRELANRLGLSPVEVSNLERGRSTLTAEGWAVAMKIVEED